MAEPTFQQLTEQVQRLTQRVSALEHELGMRREIAALPSPEPATAKAAPRASSFEANVGLRLVNRVGAVTLILGIAFFFRYAVENNWIGETARVLLGIAAGLLLLSVGEFAFRRGQNVFAQGITGAGAGVLYLASYAAFSPYNLISLSAAFSLLAALTALSAGLALRYKSEAIAVLAFAGGVLAPLLLHGGQISPWLVPVYIAVLDASLLQIAQANSWRSCEWLALAATVLFTVDMTAMPLRVLLPIYYLLFAVRRNRALFAAAHLLLLGRASFLPQQLWVYAPNVIGMSLAGMAVVQWRKWTNVTSILVAAAGISWAIGGTHLPLTGALLTATALFALFLLTPDVIAMPLNAAIYFAACYMRLAGWGHSYAALLALALAGVYFSLALRLREFPRQVSGGIAVAFLTAAIPIQFSAFRITLAWALEGAALIWIAAKRKIIAARYFGLAVLLGAVLHFFVSDLYLSSRLPTAIGVAAALFLAAFWLRWAPSAIVGHIVLLAAIAFEVFHRAGETNAASAIVSILFAAYAVALIAVGTAARTAENRYAGLGLIALVVLKLYLYDVWQLNTIYRFIAFAALGALLLATSFLYSRYRDRIASWLTSPAASEAHPPPPQE